MALGMCTAKAPTKGLSTLNSMAFGLAVYASQCVLRRVGRPHLMQLVWLDQLTSVCATSAR